MQKLILSALGVALVANLAYAVDYEVIWNGKVGTSIAESSNWAHDWTAEEPVTGLPDTFKPEVPEGYNFVPVIKSDGKATLSTGEEYSSDSWLLINGYWGDITLMVDGGTLKLAKQLVIGRYDGWGTFEMKSGTATVGALHVAHWNTSHDAVARFTGGDFLAKSYDWTGAITVGLQNNNTRGKMIIDGGHVATTVNPDVLNDKGKPAGNGNVTVANAQMWAGETGVDDGFPEESYWALSNTLDVVSGVLSITGKLNIAAANRSVGIVTLSGGRIDITDAVQMSYSSNALSRLVISGGEFNMTEDEIVMFSEDWQGSDVDKSYVTNSVAEVVLDGGVLTTKRIRRHPNTTSKARITFNGGTLQPIDNRTDFLDVTNFDSVNVAEGGIVIDTAGYDVTISGDFTGVGGLVKKGAGTLKVANGRKWSGATTVLEGTLDLNNAGDPIDDTLVVSSAGTVVNAVVTPESVEFRGDGTISLLCYGKTYGDYTAGSIKIAGGSVKIPNRFNALLYDADAHYDPSVADSLTTDADGKVTKVANLGKLGSAMDAAAYDATDVATVSSAAKINDLTALSFANNYGYASAGTVNIADNQGRTMFSVGCRSNIGDNAQMFHIGYHNCIQWDGLGATAIHQLPWGDYSIRFIACCETNGYASTSWDLYSYGNNYGNMLDQVNVFDMRCTGEKLEGNNAFRVNGEWKSESATVLASDFESFKLIGGTEHVVLGYRDGNRTPSSGLLGETLAYSRALSDTERDDVKAYLQNKWVDSSVETAAVGETGVATLALAENAAVDFDGAPVVIENLVGGGAIIGGTGYTITGSITIEVGEAGAIVPFAFDGPVTIGEGVVLNIVGAANLSKEKVVFLSVSNGAISGKIASVTADDGKAATASKSSGTSYCVNKGKLGLSVVLR
jgi:autotransporter-associated beta strand protein